jgi:hypothetical protein
VPWQSAAWPGKQRGLLEAFARGPGLLKKAAFLLGAQSEYVIISGYLQEPECAVIQQ